MSSLLNACASVLVALVALEPSGGWAQATPGGTTAVPAGRGIRRTTRVLVVDDTPNPCRFSASLQEAIDAASDGDVVLVKGGSYSPPGFFFEVNGKSIFLIGEDLPVLGREIRFRNCAGTVVLRGFNVGGFPILATDCPGFVWVEDCLVLRTDAVNSRMGVFRSESDLLFPIVNTATADLASTFVAYHSSFHGPDGLSVHCASCTAATSGRTSFFVLNSSLAYLIGSRIRGGDGGLGDCCVECFDLCFDDGCGGHGIIVNPQSSAYVLDTFLEGGFSDTCPGQALVGQAQIVQRKSGEFWIDSPVAAGQPLQLHARGPVGWRVFLRQSDECVPSFEPAYRGYALVPVARLPTFVGEIPASGALDLAFPAGHLVPPGAEARVLYVQADFYDPATDISVLGTPTAVVVYRDPCL